MATAVETVKRFKHFGPFGEAASLPLLTGPERKETFDSVPVIDLSALQSKDPNARAVLAQELLTACKHVGFFYASGHGVDNEIIRNAMQEVKDFFAMPVEEKQKVHWHQSPSAKGYENLFDMRHESWGNGDMKEAFSFTGGQDPDRNLWPQERPDFRSALAAYHSALYDLGRRLHSIFAAALDLPENYFPETYKPCGASVRCLHYPPQNPQNSVDQVGIGAHTDGTWFTILHQDGTGGLDVQNANGEWISVVPKEGTFVINIGDSMQWVSGGTMLSTRHRVMNRTGQERFSLAFFWSANGEDELRVAEPFRVPGREYRKLVVKEYSRMRFLGSRQSHPGLKAEKSEEVGSEFLPTRPE